jgi:hypothetical protein
MARKIRPMDGRQGDKFSFSIIRFIGLSLEETLLAPTFHRMLRLRIALISNILNLNLSLSLLLI